VENSRPGIDWLIIPIRTIPFAQEVLMSDPYPAGLPSSGDPFSDMPIIDEEAITERDEQFDDEFVDDEDAIADDEIDIARGDGPILDDDDDLL
jgi:hypothetical protein